MMMLLLLLTMIMMMMMMNNFEAKAKGAHGEGQRQCSFSAIVFIPGIFFWGGVGISPGPDFAPVLPMGVAFSMRPISVAYTWPVRAAVDG